MQFTRPLMFVATTAMSVLAAGESQTVDTTRGDALLADYFRQQTKQIADATFADISSSEDWKSKRGELRRQLREMLGLDPLPEKTPLHPVVAGRVEHEELVVEKLHFQSRPGLYVTANLYLPRQASEPAPAVLYVCGHAPARQNGVSLGNKASYQHHPAWFARHGYVCLVIDTLQLGEIEGLHHGTYREGMFWWNARGYTPAGVEAWNCIRALDYLETRPEVDTSRIGVTGRSGGGAYSWWVAALDDRIQVAVPVAGIASLENHVVDGCVEGHCDCMYMINTYRWDFPTVAALVAPRPLLISNTDKDRIFPLDGVYDVFEKTKRIYELYGATDKLGLHICEGGHKDTQQLRIHAFQWMNRWLKGEEPLIEKPAVELFEAEQLRVFANLPAHQLNTTIHETFVAGNSDPPLPKSQDEWGRMRDQWKEALRERVFRGWPEEGQAPPLKVAETLRIDQDAFRLRVFEFTSQHPFRLPLYVATRTGPADADIQSAMLECCDQQQWEQIMRGLKAGFPQLDIPATLGTPLPEKWTEIANELFNSRPDQPAQHRTAWVGFAPRGIGPTQWTTDKREQTHIARRFVLLGQTLDGMRVWDTRRALQAARAALEIRSEDVRLHASRDAGVWALYASLFEPVQGLHLFHPPPRHRDGPVLLNVSRYLDLPQVVTMAVERAPVQAVFPDGRTTWDFATQTMTRLQGEKKDVAWDLEINQHQP